MQKYNFEYCNLFVMFFKFKNEAKYSENCQMNKLIAIIQKLLRKYEVRVNGGDFKRNIFSKINL